MRQRLHGIVSIALAAAAAAPVMLGACAVGAPPGFSSGDTWGFPLIGPLEDGLLVVPVKVNGKGPYLFLIDPDSPMSSVDSGIANELDLYSVQTPQLPDESDTLRSTVTAETGSIAIAELTVSNKQVLVLPMQRFFAGGRMLRGVIGRDIVTEGLTVAIDRERGMLYLATQQGRLEPPPGAIEVKGRRFKGRLLVDAVVNRGKKVSLSVDIGAVATMLWPALIEATHLPVRPIQATLVDELATQRQVTAAGLAAKLAVGAAESDAVMILPYADKRRRETDLDGALGQTFLSDYHVTINYHRNTMWLKRRPADASELAAERMRRWGNRLEKCAAPACASIALDPNDPAAPTPPGQPRRIAITREDAAVELDYEILFEAIGADGQPLGLPRLRATLPAGVKTVTDPRGADYAAAAGFRVLDLSPFPRPCEGEGAGRVCMWAVGEGR